jgi:hypothetical protein
LALFVGAICAALTHPPVQAAEVDLSQAVVVAPADLAPLERQAVRLLVVEVARRCGIRWAVQTNWPDTTRPVIALGGIESLRKVGPSFAAVLPTPSGTPPAEGFRLFATSQTSQAAVFVAGNDPRGVLYGAGRLVRELDFTPGGVSIPASLDLTTAPKTRLRGHQLGYRPKTHSYDAWDVPTWEQYLRDLVLFGCNAIELIPPRSDDDADSPHYPLPPMQMMVEMSHLADAYGLDVWVWYPAMDPDYSQPATVETALREWTEVLSKLPRLDVVFVPGGDPGHTRPVHLMALLEQQARELRKHHPKAQLWMSPQSFNAQWMEEFIAILKDQNPDWLGGVVYGPQVRVPLAKLREIVPARYPIRHYPDITHTRQCQFPVQDWDAAFAVTEGRECINPRPVDEATIFRATHPGTLGFITYSEGCNDDVNKAVWSALGWDPERPVVEVLRDFSKVFVGGAQADAFAQGLLALERNWRGPLVANAGVETTLAQFQAMERAASPGTLRNWRFQQALFRAYYDAYIRRRLLHESNLESLALERLRTAAAGGSQAAMADAERILDEVNTRRVAPELRARIFELGEALFQSISMQLSVERYKAIAVDRGASLDTVDYPLNNRPWLKERFARIRRLPDEAAKLRAIAEILDWENPGPGGFYDDPGNSSRQPHLVQGAPFAEDPGRFSSPRVGFEEDLVVDEPDEKPDTARRLAWIDHAEVIYEGVLRMRYTGLDPKATYKLRVVYAGDNPKRKLRLAAAAGAGEMEIHPLLLRPFPYKPLEFDLPPQTTASGTLELSWTGEPGLGGNGRGCQVSETWLIRKP